MRIEQLRLQAFGPYVEQQVIDFSQLQSHLFLIRGETGAGKTAILDAITYAIYGYSSGGDRGEFESMRSRLADAKTKTFVECIVCIQQRRYRFYRQIEVYKKRNDELSLKTKIDAGELLEDGFYPFFENCKQRNVEEKAQQLIGLSYAQFIQVMMLPQGKFEQLLVSSSEAKQEILKSLFQVEKWADVCDRLSEKAKNDKDALDQTRVEIQMLLQQSKVETIEDFDKTLQDVQEQYKLEVIKADEVHEQYQEVLKQAQRQAQLHDVKKQYDVCQAQWHALHLQKDEMLKLATQIQTYQQYIHVKPYYDAMIQSKQRCKERELQIQELKRQEQTLCQEQQSLQQEKLLLEPKEQALVAKKREYETSLKEYEQFAQREELSKTYDAMQLRLKEAQTDVLKTKKEQEKMQGEYTILVDENKTLEIEIQRYPEDVRQEQVYTTMLANHQQVLQYGVQIEDHERTLQTLQLQYTKRMEQMHIAKQEHEVMYQHFLDHSAELLAQSLVDGHPCPVCGSKNHPSHTHIEIGNDVVINLRTCKQTLEKVREETQKLHEKIQIEVSQIQNMKQQVQTLKEQIAKILPDGYEEKKHYLLKALCKKGEEQMQKRSLNLHKIEELTQTLQKIEEQQKHLQDSCHRYEQELTILQTKLEERKPTSTFENSSQLQAYIQQQKQMIETYEQEIQRHIEKAQSNTQAYAVTLSELTMSNKEYEKEQASYNINQAQYEKQDIKIPPEIKWEDIHITTDTQRLAHYEQQYGEATSALKQLSSQLEHETLQDMDFMQKQVKTIQALYQESTKIVAHYESELKMLQTAKKATHKLQKKWELALGNYEQLNSFVKVMRGDNRIGIERYVLGVMLSQITQVANQLLKNVHHGRYQIYRSDETSGRVRKFGLELSIYDTYSCSQRSVVSLSGGEKFLVSLALSLALSTVVQARSGGIYLETMFIDEGFGSLDEQSIADALQVLSSMGQSKAMIGIISHVELLKENIPYGIQVHKKRVGSSLTMLY